METKVSSPKQEVIIGNNNPTVLIGERINPAGRQKLQEALKAGELEIIRKEAKAQRLSEEKAARERKAAEAQRLSEEKAERERKKAEARRLAKEKADRERKEAEDLGKK